MSITSHDPRSGDVLTTHPDSTAEEVDRAVAAAVAAGGSIAATAPAARRAWLVAVAEALDADRPTLVGLADRETALGVDRLDGELTRTANQFRFYADVALEGSYLGVVLDGTSDAGTALVRVNRPVGPVAVFGASNFPFAFGLLGNDTASALAAGCPVVAKHHPAHPGLSERLAEVATAALCRAGAPDGTFAAVAGFEAGTALVTAADIAAVAFTGSGAGGTALWRAANDRTTPIPVYAEMGTVNPVVVTAAAPAARPTLAEDFVAGVVGGNGQFCTKPGLLLAPAGHGIEADVAAALRRQAPAPVMLTSAIAAGVRAGLDRLASAGAEVVVLLDGPNTGWGAPAALLRADSAALADGGALLEECFGPVAIVCEYADRAERDAVLGALPGMLAAAVVSAGADDDETSDLIETLAGRAGRVVVNGPTTGVACTWAQHHGGPWPSTSDRRATSVGAAALDRFVRPVAYQSVPDAHLPPAAQAANPWRVPRRVDGRPEGPLAP